MAQKICCGKRKALHTLKVVRTCALISFLLATANVCTGQTAWYNTDSLLRMLARNEKISGILHSADSIYMRAKLDTANVSLTAFKVAYLEKCLIDTRAIHIRHRHRYRNKKILTVVDYTKKGNARRFATIDLVHGRLLFDTLVSQGSGKGEHKNDKYQVPVFFSNTINSEEGSLGLILARKARQTRDPCHLCRYAVTEKHKDVVVLEGMEKGINDNVKRRDIVMHTTGSKDLGNNRRIKRLKIKDGNYHVAESECKCYHTNDDGKITSIAAYTSACGLSENNGYPGQSNGCLVLPEDDHIAIMKTIKKRSLIFIYSNVINEEYNYFENSPVVAEVEKFAQDGH